MDKFRILVCGSRDIPHMDAHALTSALEEALMTRLGKLYTKGWQSKQVVIVHGGANGVDSHIDEIAKFYGICTEVWRPAFVSAKFLADLNVPHERTTDLADKWNRKAPLQRNWAMIQSKPNVVLAFTGAEVTGGTGHTMKLAREAGIPVDHVVITPQTEETAGDPWAAQNTDSEGFVANDEEVAHDITTPHCNCGFGGQHDDMNPRCDRNKKEEA